MCKAAAVLLLIIAFVGAKKQEGQESGVPTEGAGTRSLNEGSKMTSAPPRGTGITRTQQRRPANIPGVEEVQVERVGSASSDDEDGGNESGSAKAEAADSTIIELHYSEPQSSNEDQAQVKSLNIPIEESSEETEELTKKLNDNTGKKGGHWDVSLKCRDCLCYFATDCALQRQCETPTSIFGLGAGFEKGDCGPFHISFPFWADAYNEKMDLGDAQMEHRWRLCSTDLMCSTEAIQKYFHKYPRDCNRDGKVDCIDYAAIHTLGPYGCMDPQKLNYWNESRRKEMLQCMVSTEEGLYAKKMKELNKKLEIQDFAAKKLAEIEKNKRSDPLEIKVYRSSETEESEINGSADEEEKPQNKGNDAHQEHIRGGIIHL